MNNLITIKAAKVIEPPYTTNFVNILGLRNLSGTESVLITPLTTNAKYRNMQKGTKFPMRSPMF